MLQGHGSSPRLEVQHTTTMLEEAQPSSSIRLPTPFTSLQPSTTTRIAICNITPMKAVLGSMRPSPTLRKMRGTILSWPWTVMATSTSLTTAMMDAVTCDYRVESTASGRMKRLPARSM